MEKEEGIYLTESNVMDILKKLTNKTDVKPEEFEQVKKRFLELVNHK